MENQIKKRLLVRIEKIEGQKPKLLESRILYDSDPVKTKILDVFPEIEIVAGRIGKYDVDEQGNVVVVYEEAEKSELEKLKEEIAVLKSQTLSTMEAVATIFESQAEGGDSIG